jgi:hypothetical protein
MNQKHLILGLAIILLFFQASAAFVSQDTTKLNTTRYVAPNDPRYTDQNIYSLNYPNPALNTNAFVNELMKIFMLKKDYNASASGSGSVDLSALFGIFPTKPVGDANISSLDWSKILSKPYLVTETDIDNNALEVINALDLNNSLNYLKAYYDTNWETGYPIFDANMRLRYTLQSDGNSWYLKVADFNSFGDQRYVQKVGDTMSGGLTISSGTTNNLIVSDSGGTTKLTLNGNRSIVATGGDMTLRQPNGSNLTLGSANGAGQIIAHNNIVPNSTQIIGTGANPFTGIYSNYFYGDGTNLSGLILSSDANLRYYTQSDLNNNGLFIKTSDSNNAGRLASTVIFNPPWITSAGADSNWQTSWATFDANMKATYNLPALTWTQLFGVFATIGVGDANQSSIAYSKVTGTPYVPTEADIDRNSMQLDSNWSNTWASFDANMKSTYNLPAITWASLFGVFPIIGVGDANQSGIAWSKVSGAPAIMPDTNWQTSWVIFDTNMKSYYSKITDTNAWFLKISDANIVYAKISDVNGKFIPMDSNNLFLGWADANKNFQGKADLNNQYWGKADTNKNFQSKADTNMWFLLLTNPNLSLPTLSSGQYLTNNGTTLSWGTPAGAITDTNAYTDGFLSNPLFSGDANKALNIDWNLSNHSLIKAKDVNATSGWFTSDVNVGGKFKSWDLNLQYWGKADVNKNFCGLADLNNQYLGKADLNSQFAGINRYAKWGVDFNTSQNIGSDNNVTIGPNGKGVIWWDAVNSAMVFSVRS